MPGWGRSRGRFMHTQNDKDMRLFGLLVTTGFVFSVLATLGLAMLLP